MASKNPDEDYLRYINQTYYGKELLKEHALFEKGVWMVYGEDPNCDFGGLHHNPFLGTFKGRLDDVIHEAVALSGFWHWGAGGKIVKGEIKPVETRIAKRFGSTNSSASLFDLIEQKTKEGKIKWEGHQHSDKLKGVAPGTDMSLEMSHYIGDQRDPADDYSLMVRINGNTTNISTSDVIKKLWKWIVENPARTAEADAREILEAL